ncbi:TRAP transporter substrate-binding protein DctP [Aquibaculum arenosum]|uniref:TRAP transporter substrate-binding protein DctP n=1 Tax=Aquibaculum arenosum TaxID=3032591 RepID=A0ABT5YMD7_9PROT|nr:TRAP transporter substrate-binding protein DctP [Fodinicurvata sp. CAU 1616]MDF2096126.1 TRAP transporter substrate-binding protein DctP [Fodinicurvata sp. CAU 1616]
MSMLKRTTIMGAIFGLASLSGAQVSGANEPILAHIMDSEHIWHGASERFMQRMDELSGGDFQVAYHPGGDLGDWTSIIEQVAQGSVQMTLAWNYGELDPRWDISNLAFIAEDWEQGEAVFGPGSTMEGVYQDIMNDLNMVLLGIIPTDFTGFVVRNGIEPPLNYPEDAQGFKMRVPAQPLSIESYGALGFSVVPMAFSEVHTALQTGAIDGRAVSPPSEVLMFKDVIDTYVYTRHNFEHTFWLANKQWFDSLETEQQEWIRTAATEAVEWTWENAEAQSPRWFEEMREAGIEVIELTPEQQEAYKKLTMEVEYPYMEQLVGPEVMEQIRSAAEASE